MKSPLQPTKKIKEINEKINDEIAEEGENIVSRAKSSASMQVRNILLASKGTSLDAAFDASADAFASLPEDSYVAFLTGIAGDALKSAPCGTACTISLCQRDIDRSGKAILQSLTEAYGNVIFTLSDTPARIRGGMMLDFGNTDIDCSIETVIAQARPSLEAKVCTILFDRSAPSK